MTSQSRTALELLRDRAAGTTAPLSFGCPLLDESTGGIPPQGITELSGEAGCGKTQLCLTLALQVQLDLQHGGRDGAAAYLSCGEGTFPIRRLSQMAQAFAVRTGLPQERLLSNVHIEHCYNIDDAQTILRYKIPELCQQKGVRLLVIDSLAGLVRFEYDSAKAQEMQARTKLLFSLGRELKLLADIFRICIVVVNQVRGSGFADNVVGRAAMETSGSAPALGLAWAHNVNTRLSLHVHPQANRVGMEGEGGTNWAGGGEEVQEDDASPESSVYSLQSEAASLSAGDRAGGGAFYSCNVGAGVGAVGVGTVGAGLWGEAFDIPLADKENAPTCGPSNTSSRAFSGSIGNSVSTGNSGNIGDGEGGAEKDADDGGPGPGPVYTGSLKLHENITYYPAYKGGTSTTAPRFLLLEFSPIRGRSEVPYQISTCGVTGAP
ncbi:P-loop containing nucleoside triphosphate hydrolase protein [Ochromonadaceae sp. CCMP2298]|nr:P-loop containing nucleoside triphosphate hydrolase protein [Ochromonadaceae sp. CCMP2298]